MSRSTEFARGASEHHNWPPAIGIAHNPEAVEVSQKGDPWFHPTGPGGEVVPLSIHELPHEMRERYPGLGEAKGRPIDVASDPRIPSHVYHVSVNKPSIVREGLIRASPGSGGGLGGHHSHLVSLTTDRRTAMEIHSHLKFALGLAQRFGPTEPEWKSPEHEQWGRGVVAHLKRQAHKEGWKFTSIWSPHQYASYGLSDMMGHYGSERASKHPDRTEVARNPLIVGSHWERMDPNHVGIVRVPRLNIVRTGALVTDLDLRESLRQRHPQLGKHGLHEIQVHGDVPL